MPAMPPALFRVPTGADRLVVVMSDIEMGGGGPILDDFPHDAWLAELIGAYNEGPFARLAVDLVFNGDTLDLLKTPYQGGYPHRIDAEVALTKLDAIARSHPDFFSGIRGFLSHASAPRRVIFVPGNHDHELVFPEVQAALRRLCGGHEHVLFPGLECNIGDLHIQHGAQFDTVFAVDPEVPFLEDEGEPILNLAWGSVALLRAILPLQSLLYFHDRMKPKTWLLDLVPELRELLLGRMWQYWTRDYWAGLFDPTDPTRALSWTAVKEVLRRFSSKDPDVRMQADLDALIRVPEGPRVVAVGHLHETRLYSFGDRKLLQAGCLRDEYMIADGGRRLRPIPKSYLEIYQRGADTIRSLPVEVEGPGRPAEEIPDSVFEMRDQIIDQLGPDKGRQRDIRAQDQQAKKEDSES